MRGGPSQATIAAAGFVLALSLVATALAGSAPREGQVHGGGVSISAAAAGAMRIEDSRGGRAILRATALAPGARVVGKVAISNRGEAGHLVLSRQHLVGTPGAGGASLGGALRLTIRNVTTGARTLVYSGPLTAMPPLHLGPAAAGDEAPLQLRRLAIGAGVRRRRPDGLATPLRLPLAAQAEALTLPGVGSRRRRASSNGIPSAGRAAASATPARQPPASTIGPARAEPVLTPIMIESESQVKTSVPVPGGIATRASWVRAVIVGAMKVPQRTPA
jgi:hypothetical protein